MIKTKVLIGLSKVIILWIWAVTKLLPIIISTEINIQTYNGFLYPLAIKTANTIYDNSSSIANIMNRGSPKGIPITPIIIIDINMIKTGKFDFAMPSLLINDISTTIRPLICYLYSTYDFLIWLTHNFCLKHFRYQSWY